jgi:hypothetical protein
MRDIKASLHDSDFYCVESNWIILDEESQRYDKKVKKSCNSSDHLLRGYYLPGRVTEYLDTLIHWIILNNFTLYSTFEDLKEEKILLCKITQKSLALDLYF